MTNKELYQNAEKALIEVIGRHDYPFSNEIDSKTKSFLISKELIEPATGTLGKHKASALGHEFLNANEKTGISLRCFLAKKKAKTIIMPIVLVLLGAIVGAVVSYVLNKCT